MLLGQCSHYTLSPVSPRRTYSSAGLKQNMRRMFLPSSEHYLHYTVWQMTIHCYVSTVWGGDYMGIFYWQSDLLCLMIFMLACYVRLRLFLFKDMYVNKLLYIQCTVHATVVCHHNIRVSGLFWWPAVCHHNIWVSGLFWWPAVCHPNIWVSGLFWWPLVCHHNIRGLFGWPAVCHHNRRGLFWWPLVCHHNIRGLFWWPLVHLCHHNIRGLFWIKHTVRGLFWETFTILLQHMKSCLEDLQLFNPHSPHPTPRDGRWCKTRNAGNFLWEIRANMGKTQIR